MEATVVDARHIIVPKNKEDWLRLRTSDITSTEISALFGCSPYMTEFELWHRKKDNIEVEFEENERMKWGTRLQDSIAKGIAEDKGWKVRRMEEYIRIPALRMGSSFDFFITEWQPKIVAPPTDHNHSPVFAVGEPGLLEIKNVDSLQFRDGWLEDADGNIEAPPHIELQVQHQLAVSGIGVAYIGALVGGNRVTILKRDADQKIINAIREKVVKFWYSISAGIEPQPDFGRDADIIARLYNFVEPGKIFDANNNKQIKMLMQNYKCAAEAEKLATSQKESIKAEVLTLVGDAEKIISTEFSISAGITPSCLVNAFTRAAFRMFRPSWRKSKEEK